MPYNYNLVAIILKRVHCTAPDLSMAGDHDDDDDDDGFFCLSKRTPLLNT